jgi:hypothetical protein
MWTRGIVAGTFRLRFEKIFECKKRRFVLEECTDGFQYRASIGVVSLQVEALWIWNGLRGSGVVGFISYSVHFSQGKTYTSRVVWTWKKLHILAVVRGTW